MNQENIAALFGVIYDKYYKKILRRPVPPAKNKEKTER